MLVLYPVDLYWMRDKSGTSGAATFHAYQHPLGLLNLAVSVGSFSRTPIQFCNQKPTHIFSSLSNSTAFQFHNGKKSLSVED